MVVSLFPHNQQAYDVACAMLADTGKACIIHPTGTGKSFIGFKYCEDNPSKSVLWLSPSEYIFRTQFENLQKASNSCHCEPRGSVAIRSSSPAAVFPSSLDSELSTFNFSNIVFLTYARLMQMSDAELTTFAPNAIILDEFHRAGAEQWGQGVRKLLERFPDVPLLGLTATNIRYLDNQRDMADELFDNHIASEMTLGEAIVRGILPAPKYVLSIFKYKDDLAKYELRAQRAKSKATRDAAEEILEKLRRALDRAVGMDVLFDKHMEDRHGKYLVFCANADHMREMMTHVPEWFSKVDLHPHVYSAYSEDPGTSKAFADFKADVSDHLKLLFCIDMLNEGIHVDDVSGVILLRPTVSPIVYKQQIGRALSARKNMENNHREQEPAEPSCHYEPHSGVAIRSPSPVIFDVVMNIENLYSISSIQEEMAAAVPYYRELGSENPITEGFEVIDEVHDCLELFDRLNDTLTASWDLMYREAKKYRAENGNLEVPMRFVTADGYSLGRWLDTQRQVRFGKTRGILTENQIQLLDALGMRWESMSDRSWERFFASAKAYYKQNGNLKVNTRYETPDGLKLGNWISNVRTYRKNGIKSGYLTEERIRALDEIGMQWDVPDYLFERNFTAASEYHRTHGDLNIPTNYVTRDGLRLGVWVANLRTHYRKNDLALSQEQISRLDELGMLWGGKYQNDWDQAFEEAKLYRHTYGNLEVPTKYQTPAGMNLGRWVTRQREFRKAGRLSEDRRQKLDSLGMVW